MSCFPNSYSGTRSVCVLASRVAWSQVRLCSSYRVVDESQVWVQWGQVQYVGRVQGSRRDTAMVM